MVVSPQERAWKVVGAVEDPELPFVTLVDLGIVRRVEAHDDSVEVDLTPTYSGCPAFEVMTDQVKTGLEAAGFKSVKVQRVYSPAWTTDDISETGRRKLAEAGIAPPRSMSERSDPIVCPQCRSKATQTVSEFGSTACKALMVCSQCGEPFDRFKEL